MGDQFKTSMSRCPNGAHRSYISFCATYGCPHPDAVSQNLETRFGRRQYPRNRKFNLAYLRNRRTADLS